MMRERENGKEKKNRNSDCQSYDEQHWHSSMQQINEIYKEKESVKYDVTLNSCQ